MTVPFSFSARNHLDLTMAFDNFYYLQVASTLSVLFPIVSSFLVFRLIEPKIKWFVALLLFGFAVDLFGWYCYLTSQGSINLIVRYVYELVEALFWFWMISIITSSSLVKKVSRYAMYAIIPFWVMCLINKDLLALFETVTQVYLSFATCFCVLRMIEDDASSTEGLVFWLFIGLFFYTFCTFFFMSLLANQFDVKLWYAHNIINIAANLIYFVGFLKLRSSPDH